MNEYKDIININNHEPNYKHPRMSIYNRSAIFAPFAALTGYKEVINETSRVVDNKVVLDEDAKNIINNKLINLNDNEEVIIEYFIKDKVKNGGKYIIKKGIIKKIDYIKKQIIMMDKTIILIENIIDVK